MVKGILSIVCCLVACSSDPVVSSATGSAPYSSASSDAGVGLQANPSASAATPFAAEVCDNDDGEAAAVGGALDGLGGQDFYEDFGADDSPTDLNVKKN